LPAQEEEMTQAKSPNHSGTEANQSALRMQFYVLALLGFFAAILVIGWVIQNPISAAPPGEPPGGDLASALIPILAAAIGINLFIEMGFNLFEQYNRTLIAYVGRGLRWLRQAEMEVSRARQWQAEVYERYSHQLEELDKVTEQIAETEDPQKIVEVATARIKAARELLDLAEARVNNADAQLDRLTNHSSYLRVKSAISTYFCILLGLLIATATSMQIFAVMGVQLSNPRMDVILTGIFIGGLVFPVHQVIANIWDILTKLVKK